MHREPSPTCLHQQAWRWSNTYVFDNGKWSEGQRITRRGTCLVCVNLLHLQSGSVTLGLYSMSMHYGMAVEQIRFNSSRCLCFHWLLLPCIPAPSQLWHLLSRYAFHLVDTIDVEVQNQTFCYIVWLWIICEILWVLQLVVVDGQRRTEWKRWAVIAQCTHIRWYPGGTLHLWLEI